MTTEYSLTKSDFILFLDAPKHLWAKVNHQAELTPSPLGQEMIRQGYEVEALGKTYLARFVVNQAENQKLVWQETFTDQSYITRVDGLVYKPNSESYDLYEIKSGTSLDKDHYYDCAFQLLVLEASIKVDRVFLLHLNKEYIRGELLDIESLFIAEDITEKTVAILDDVRILRNQALTTALSLTADTLLQCFNPKTCPCLNLCYPNLPQFSIFDVPMLKATSKQTLLDMSIRSAADIPNSFRLSDKQRLVVQLARTEQEIIDRQAIQREMDQFNFPLYFLDYETYNAAIPLFPGYHPQQQMVFQYSLHIIDAPGGDLRHEEHLSYTTAEPSLLLLDKLRQDIGGKGTVLVWNKSFEMTCNKNMAKVHPEFNDFLDDINSRVYDLGDFISKGYYLHPGFKGSWSIKNVLPVMVPDLSYEILEIGNGEEATTRWWQMVYRGMPDEESIATRRDLLAYCEMDTLAMVKIYERLIELSQG
ncbi:MAG: DUF2779 domain-containing protein [Anaerolineaceae bacterium]|nr:DUF2779 domain-containing protein [Anaerolineaceae bacterium]